MKKLLLAFTFIAFFSCSKEESCDEEIDRIMNNYEKALEDPMISDRRKQILLDERAEALAKACN